MCELGTSTSGNEKCKIRNDHCKIKDPSKRIVIKHLICSFALVVDPTHSCMHAFR